jgi:hypothetical protein
MFRRLLLILFIVFHSQLHAETPAHAKPGQFSAIQFQQSAQQSDTEQLRLRLHASEQPPAYDLTKETYDLLVPKSYKSTVPHGLLIWISAGNDVKIPKEWEAILAEKKLIFIGARNSGNPRNLFDRARLAIDANVNMRDRYNIDGRRVYVSGFSGGSRVASMVGVAFGEMFSGALCCMGVNFYTDVLGTDNLVYRLNYIPDDEVLALSKKFCRYVLYTGSKDFNRPNTLGAFQGFKKEGFPNVEVFDIPEQGHSFPNAAWFKKGLDYLDEGKALKGERL